MIDRRVLVMFASVVTACSSPDEAITFDHSDGTGSSLSECVCEYYDGTDNDWSLQVTCTSGNSTLESLNMFADPRNTAGDGDGKLIFIPASTPANYAAGAVAVVSPIGEPTDASSTRVLRNLENVGFRWDEQDACNVAQPCQIDSFHLLAGSVSGGHGACEDYYATQRLILGS